MVKNLTGGNKSKKGARKSYSGSAPGQTGLVLSTNSSEIYAVITRINGNGMCEAQCIDGKIRLCIIRKKFKGRRKRDNTIKVGSWVLVGLREWETNTGKQKTDLLTIYSENDREKIMAKSNDNFVVLIETSKKIEENDYTQEDIGLIDIDNTDTTEYDEFSSTNKTTLVIDEEDIDFDDI